MVPHVLGVPPFFQSSGVVLRSDRRTAGFGCWLKLCQQNSCPILVPFSEPFCIDFFFSVAFIGIQKGTHLDFGWAQRESNLLLDVKRENATAHQQEQRGETAHQEKRGVDFFRALQHRLCLLGLQPDKGSFNSLCLGFTDVESGGLAGWASAECHLGFSRRSSVCTGSVDSKSSLSNFGYMASGSRIGMSSGRKL